MLREGRVVEAGALDALKQSSDFVRNLKVTVSEVSGSESESSSDSEQLEHVDKHSSNSEAVESADEDATDDQSRQTGDFAVYAYYARAAGRLNIVLSLVFAFMWAFCNEFSSTLKDGFCIVRGGFADMGP